MLMHDVTCSFDCVSVDVVYSETKDQFSFRLDNKVQLAGDLSLWGS